MTFEEADARADLEARRNHGVLTYDGLLNVGFTEPAIRTRVDSGRLIRIHRGVYVPRAYPRTHLTDVAAALAVAGPDAFASHRCAGGDLYELDGVPTGVVEISLRTGKRIAGATTRRLQPNDRPRTRYVRGIRCTSVERTLRDLAAVLPPHLVGRAIDDALRRKLSLYERLCREYERTCGPGQRGTRTFRQLLELRDPDDEKVRSVETKMLRILRRIRTEKVVPNYRVVVDGRNRYIDFAFPRHKVGVETHSLKWHFGEEKWQKDLARDRRLTLLGWTMLYFARDDVLFRPPMILDEVQDALDLAVLQLIQAEPR